MKYVWRVLYWMLHGLTFQMYSGTDFVKMIDRTEGKDADKEGAY